MQERVSRNQNPETRNQETTKQQTTKPTTNHQPPTTKTPKHQNTSHRPPKHQNTTTSHRTTNNSNTHQVHVKLSALFRLSRRGGAHGYDDMPPFFDALLQAYGADRLLWGSDFPFVQLQEGGYAAALSAIVEWCRGLQPSQAAAVCGGTAERLFRF